MPPTSLWRTPLEVVLPAEPAARSDGAFRIALADLGERHPVTRGLREGSASDPPHWSQCSGWSTAARKGTAVMPAPTVRPLLVLSREGEGGSRCCSPITSGCGRAATKAAGRTSSLRRLSHWLIKQPDLEEEALRLFVRGRDLTVQRQTMAEGVERDSRSRRRPARAAT